MSYWKFKENAEPQGSSDGFWYDIANGYIHIESLLEHEDQMNRIWEALETLQSFEKALEDNDLLIEF